MNATLPDMNATQGPWEITSEPDDEHPVYDIGHRHQDGSVLLVCETISSRQAEDARLIAAAPDLLDALYTTLNLEQAALAGAPHGLDVAYHFDKVRAAIAKATNDRP